MPILKISKLSDDEIQKWTKFNSSLDQLPEIKDNFQNSRDETKQNESFEVILEIVKNAHVTINENNNSTEKSMMSQKFKKTWPAA